MKLRAIFPIAVITFASAFVAAQEKSKVLEEIIVRVNNEIITNSELDRARRSLRDEVREDCKACTPQEMEAQLVQREKNLLRDLIDTSLLVQRCKDAGINVESDVVRRMDAVRIQNNLADMDALEKAVTQSGVNFEDFKNEIRRGLCTQQVIRKEVAPDVKISPDEVKDYYEKHKKEFDRPEMVALSEIFLATDGKTEADLPEIEKKIRGYLDRIKNGEDFSALATHFSEGSTAKDGGFLGEFQRGQLSKEYEDTVFKMNKGQMTDIIRSKTGFLFLRIEERYEAGIQPLEKVTGFISNSIYQQKVQPALRAYLNRLRQESYVQIKSGYEDTAGVTSAAIQEVQPVPEDEKSKKKKNSDKKQEEPKKEKPTAKSGK